MDRIIRVLTIITISILTVVVSVSAAQLSKPSSWATLEVTTAQNKGLVPSVLQNNYQNNIKRYEYVLLALELLDEKNQEVLIARKNPFTDISGHPYETKIVIAFNAGIISGYEDGTFKPNNEISREEIATLVVNLVKNFDPNRIISQLGDMVYADNTSIGSWAIKNVNYCYANTIIKGVGKNASNLDYINPKGKATVEQSIMMMYRLAVKEKAINPYNYAAIELFDSIGYSGEAIKSYAINDFAKINGTKLAELVINIEKKSNVTVTELSGDNVTLAHEDGSTIRIYRSKYQLDLYLDLKNNDNNQMVSDYLTLIKSLNGSKLIDTLINDSVSSFVRGNPVFQNETISTMDRIKIYEDIVFNTKLQKEQRTYLVRYNRDL